MKSKVISFSIMLIPALLGMAVLALSTHYGPGIGGDATIYIKSAENLLHGNGLGLVGPDGEFRIIPYFPPFYSLVLAFLGLFSIDPVQGAFWLNLIMFAGIILISGIALYQACHSLVPAVLVEICVLASPVLIPVYSWAMSEPLAIFLGFLGLILLLRYLQSSDSVLFLLFSAVICGLSFLTRYIAVIYLAVGMAGILFFSRNQLSRRLKHCLLYFITGFLPMMVWLVFDWMHTSTVASRSVLGEMGLQQRLAELSGAMQNVFLFWLIPDSWIDHPFYPFEWNRFLLVACLVILVVWCLFSIIWVWRSDKLRANSRWIQLSVMMGLFCLGYVMLSAVVYLTTYPPITIGSRMYAPMHVAFIWLAGLLGGLFSQDDRLSIWRRLFLVAMVVFSGWYAVRSTRIVQQNYEIGLGYLSPEWQESQTVQAVKEISPDTLLVTNEETALLFLVERPAYSLAEIYATEPRQQFTRYGDVVEDGDDGQSVFRNDGAALVLFDSINDQMSGLYGEQVSKRIQSLTQGLDKVFQGDDGAIYYYPVR